MAGTLVCAKGFNNTSDLFNEDLVSIKFEGV